MCHISIRVRVVQLQVDRHTMSALSRHFFPLTLTANYNWHSLQKYVSKYLECFFIGKILPHQVQRTFGARASLVPVAGDRFSPARNWSGSRTRWPLTFSSRTRASSGLVVAITGFCWCSLSSRRVRVSSVGTHENTCNLQKTQLADNEQVPYKTVVFKIITVLIYTWMNEWICQFV